MFRARASYMPLLLAAACSLLFLLLPTRAFGTTVYVTSGTTWAVPSDWSSTNTIEVIGGGAGGSGSGTNLGGGGAGGGGYSKITNTSSLTPGSTVGVAVGSGGGSNTSGGDTYLCSSTSNCASILGSAVLVGAKGGASTGTSSGGAGGAAASGVGATKYSGGSGGSDSQSILYGAGAGGAGGPNGNGGAGANSYYDLVSTLCTGGGGAGGGGTSASNQTGGTGSGGSGNGANGSCAVEFTGTGGSNGTEWDATHGSGGGGSGGNYHCTIAPCWQSTALPGGAGGNYGAGGGGAGGNYNGSGGNSGGSGKQGLIVITYTPDTTAPTPNPATFSSAPAGASASSVSMTATAASDTATPVAYSFAFSACGVNGGTGGTSSGWQASASYTDTLLQPNQCYGYTVQSRDALSNTGTASAQNTTYTHANAPSAPTLSGATLYTITLTNNENGNPLASPATLFAAQVTAATDGVWNGKYVDASGNASATAVWLTDAQLTNLVINGLVQGMSYTVAVKARNNNSVETAFSSGTSLSTLSDVTAPTPNPSTFSTAPTPDSATQISMIASTATDAAGSTPVTYLLTFSACGANGGTGGTSSSWQASASYSDSGLQPNQCYGYTVQSKDAITTTASDMSGNGNTGILQGSPSVVAGNSGDGLNFSTTGQVMRLNSSISLAGGTYSIVAWIKAPLPSCAGYCTLTRGGTNDHQVLVDPSHLLGAYDNAGATGFHSSGFDVTTLAAGWHHLAAVGSGTNTVFYIDGSSVGTATFKSTAQISYIGAYQGGSQQFGIIDDVRIFSTALTSGNVTTLYGGGTISTGLVGWWTFDTTGNATVPSSQTTTYTLANTPGTPSLTHPSQTTLQITNNANGNPSASPTTKYAAQIIAASDATWNNKYANASGDPSATAVWLSNAQLNNLVISGLTAGVTYQVQVKARNENSVETSFSSTGSNTTSATVDTTARYIRLRGVRLRGVRLILVPNVNVFAAVLRHSTGANII